jgi:hypothetical protein
VAKTRATTRLAAPAVALVLALGLAATTADAAERPSGTVAPTPGSGIGTKAALDNPRCRTGGDYGPYGRFDTALVGLGPICVKPWSASQNNGGATAPGVTADSVKVVVFLPTAAQNTGSAPVDRSTGGKGTFENAYHDTLLPLMEWYETWGRNIDVSFVTSSGSDEAAQRADALKVKEMKPFAVIDVVPEGLEAFDSTLASSKILVHGAATTSAKALAQAPYRWGNSEAEAGALNGAEVLGKQLAGKKAVYGGDDVKGSTRKFGLVYIQDAVNPANIKSALKKYGGGTFASEVSYQAPGSIVGDAQSAQEQAPTVLLKLKAAGVTTILLVADESMTKALMTAAEKQEYFPEWFYSGGLFADLPLFARGNPTSEMQHAFGISQGTPPDTSAPTGNDKYLSGDDGPLNWYWGDTSGTKAASPADTLVWLLSGIHAAGPKLTAKTFQQGLFSTPALPGFPRGPGIAYGKTAGLPYDMYMTYGADYSPFWWDTNLTGPPWGPGPVGKGNAWFIDDAQRFTAGKAPKQPFSYFEKAGSQSSVATSPVPTPAYARDCTSCPAHGGTVTVGTPSADGFVAKYVPLTTQKTS